jgi:hypothetical protein
MEMGRPNERLTNEDVKIFLIAYLIKKILKLILYYSSFRLWRVRQKMGIILIMLHLLNISREEMSMNRFNISK